MLLVKTKLSASKVHGMGLFADQPIPKGTITWKYTPWFDPAYSQAELEKMSEPARNQVLYYSYFDKNIGKYVLPSDDQRFINHSSKNFNISSTPCQDIATKNIEPGEELLCDYNKFDKSYFSRVGIKKEDLKC